MIEGLGADDIIVLEEEWFLTLMPVVGQRSAENLAHHITRVLMEHVRQKNELDAYVAMSLRRSKR